MRRLIKRFAVEGVGLYLTTQIASGIMLEKGYETLFLASLALVIASMFAKPVINLLLLPLNLVTFGLFRWISSAIVFYLVTLLIPGFKINFFNFAGFNSIWIDLPAINVSGILAYILFALVLSLITSIVHWAIK